MEKAKENGNAQLNLLVHSTSSLRDFEDKGFKILLPQVFAATVALLNHIVVGLGAAYSAILIPQLLSDQNNSTNTNITDGIIRVTETDISWIASALTVICIPVPLIGGVLIDFVGRLNTIKLAAIPTAAGWILIATAKSVPMLVLGRMLTGVMASLGSAASITYTVEISTPSIRGALTSLGPCITSFGMLIAYLEGWFLNWRIVAWTSVVYTAVSVVFIILFLPESPTWLISQNRIEDARKSLRWFNRYRKPNHNHTSTYPELQLKLLQKHHLPDTEKLEKAQQGSALKKLKILVEPTVYKPIIITTALFYFQQFSGLFIVIFYAVTFFDAVGTNIDANLAAILVGVTRFLMSIVTVGLMKRYNRRSLFMFSGIVMAISMFISGFFTDLMEEGKTSLIWIPPTMILFYVAGSMIGFLGIPWSIPGELFPTTIRGKGHCISMSIANVFMFLAIRLFFTLIRVLGGLSKIQYFFAIVSISGVLFSYVFLPETHNKELPEIQDYFNNHSTYLSLKRSKKQQKVENIVLK